MIDFENIDYLKTGNEKQRSAYHTLTKNQILDHLKAFDPILVGTIPIAVDIETSDLDIICCWKDEKEFAETLSRHFKHYKGFAVQVLTVYNRLTVLANFFTDDFEIEIFGQNVPVKEQWGYRHMLVENNLLAERSDDFRLEIIALKKRGYKTEPAFARLLGLHGDPYVELLQFEN